MESETFNDSTFIPLSHFEQLIKPSLRSTSEKNVPKTSEESQRVHRIFGRVTFLPSIATEQTSILNANLCEYLNIMNGRERHFSI